MTRLFTFCHYWWSLLCIHKWISK